MMDDTCDRCGQLLTENEGLCAKCVGWLREKGELSEDEVVDAAQFAMAPIDSADRIVFVIVSVALPLVLSLFAIIYPLIDVYDDRFNRSIPGSPIGPVFVVFLAVIVTLGAVFGFAVLARRRPWVAALAAAGVAAAMAVPMIVVAAMDLPPHTIVFVRMHSVPFTLDGILATLVVLQVIGVLILLGAVYLAAIRQRQIASARVRLIALARLGGDA